MKLVDPRKDDVVYAIFCAAKDTVSTHNADASAMQHEPDVLTPEEFQALLPQFDLRERVMVLPAGSTGLRRSEMFALRWRDVNFTTREVQVQRAVVRNRFGNVKTLASKKPVPLHPSVADELVQWRTQSAYRTDEDFLFPSIKLNGEVPVSPDTVLKKLTGLNTSISSSSFGLPLPRPSQQPTQPSGKPAPRILRQSTIHQSGHPKKCRYKLHLID